VYENVAFALRARTNWSPERIDEVTLAHLGMVGLRDRARDMPSQLSAGMCKRTALARALALESRIVIIDDFDSGIDGVLSDAGDGAFEDGFWTSVKEYSANGAPIVSKTHYNFLGQPYQTTRPTPSGEAVSSLKYDGVGRPIRHVDFDGVRSFFRYNTPGNVDVFLDADGNGEISGGDRRTSYIDGYDKRDGRAVLQSKTIIRGGGGVVDIAYANATSLDGADSWQDENGLITYSSLRYLAEGGESTLTVNHPDGTSSELSYIKRTLASQKHFGTGGQLIEAMSFTPDALLRGQSAQDAFGTSSADLLGNGIVNKATQSDGRTTQVLSRDAKTYIPTPSAGPMARKPRKPLTPRV